jgi:proline iminopeptidase
MGHSHGSFVIQQYALAHPDKVAGLILYGCSALTSPEFVEEAGQNVVAFAQREAGSPEADEVTDAWASIPRIADDQDYTRALRRLLPVCFADYRRVGLTYQQLRSSLQATFVTGDREPFDTRKLLPKLGIPALILAGEHDFICGPKSAEILHVALPGSQLVIFQRSGHMIHIEQPVAFAGVIGAFVFRNRKSVERRSPTRGKPNIRLLN